MPTTLAKQQKVTPVPVREARSTTEDLRKAFQTVQFLYRTGLLLFSVKYLVIPFLDIYQTIFYGYVGRRAEPVVRWFDAKVLDMVIGTLLYGLHLVLRMVLLATYPVVHAALNHVVLPMKRRMHNALVFLKERYAEANAEMVKAKVTRLEKIAVQQDRHKMPDTKLMEAHFDEQYEEETFQFTKLAFKIFYNQLQLSFLDAQFLWGYGPRDEAAEANLEMERDVLEDKREYLFAVREYDNRVEDAMRKQRMAAAAKDAKRFNPSESEADDEENEPNTTIATQRQTSRNPASPARNPSSPARNANDEPRGVAEVIADVAADVATKVKVGLGLAEEEPLPADNDEPAADISTPIAPPPKPSPKVAAAVLSPETAYLDARIHTADRLSAVAITPYAAAAVAKVQRMERHEVENAFAKKAAKKKRAYKRTRFIDRLQNVLGVETARKSNDEPSEPATELGESASSSISIGNPSAATASPINSVKEGSAKADDVEEPPKPVGPFDKVENVLPPVLEEGNKDNSRGFLEKLFGHEDPTVKESDIQDTLLPEVENPLATRTSSRPVDHDTSSEDEAVVAEKEEEAMRKQRMMCARQSSEDVSQSAQKDSPNDKAAEGASGVAFSSILQSKNDSTASKRRNSVSFAPSPDHDSPAPPQIKKQSETSAQSQQSHNSPPQVIPTELNRDELMTAYYNPFLRKAIGKNSQSMSMNDQEEDESSNDITPLTTHRSNNEADGSKDHSTNSSFGVRIESADSTPVSSARSARLPKSRGQSRRTESAGTDERQRLSEGKPVIHPYFLFAANEVEEDDDSKYMRMVSELNPF